MVDRYTIMINDERISIREIQMLADMAIAYLDEHGFTLKSDTLAIVLLDKTDATLEGRLLHVKLEYWVTFEIRRINYGLVTFKLCPVRDSQLQRLRLPPKEEEA